MLPCWLTPLEMSQKSRNSYKCLSISCSLNSQMQYVDNQPKSPLIILNLFDGYLERKLLSALAASREAPLLSSWPPLLRPAFRQSCRICFQWGSCKYSHSRSLGSPSVGWLETIASRDIKRHQESFWSNTATGYWVETDDIALCVDQMPRCDWPHWATHPHAWRIPDHKCHRPG